MRPRTQSLLIAGTLVGSLTALGACGDPRRADRLRSKLRGLKKRIEYEASGGSPNPDVDDQMLADRVRSEIGPLEKQLDLPRIHVMVHDHIAVLHGDVGTETDAERLERAVLDVVGVAGVESFLHVGLCAGDTRPSAGRRAAAGQDSHAKQVLVELASEAGATADPDALVRSVLGNFLAQVPDGERRHVLAHLPDDVRALAESERRPGTPTRHIRRLEDLYDAIDTPDVGVHRDALDEATVAVLAGLVKLAPEEADDVEATLPHEIRELWHRARHLHERDEHRTRTFIHLLERL